MSKAVFFWIALLAASLPVAAEEARQTGQQVVLRPGVSLTSEPDTEGQATHSPSPLDYIHVYKIERQEGSRLWLTDTESGLGGRVSVADTMSLPEAIDELNR